MRSHRGRQCGKSGSQVVDAIHRVLFIIVQRYNPDIHCEQAAQASRYSTQVALYTPRQ